MTVPSPKLKGIDIALRVVAVLVGVYAITWLTWVAWYEFR